MTTVEPPNDQRVEVLLTQYEAIADHHMHFMSLIWQLPAVTSGIGGVLIAIGFGTNIPIFARALVMLIGASMMIVMTVALERYRMFQLRRRKDLRDIELALHELGAMPITWDGREIVEEIRRGEFTLKGLPAYRLEGFKALRAMMYVITFILIAMSVMTIGQLFQVIPLLS